MSERRVRDFFSRHADDYARSRSHAEGGDLSRLMELLAPTPDARALDVATGTGFTAMALARLAGSVEAVDITAEMLSKAREMALREGISNLAFGEGEATHLPFKSRAFDVVTSRRAPHHFPDVASFMREATRVLKAGGRLGIADMSPVEGTQYHVNLMETLRDSSHARALTLKEWAGTFESAGLEVMSAELMPEFISFERWLSPVPPGGEEERAIVRACVEFPDRVNALMNLKFDGARVGGFVKTRAVVVGRRVA
ncbi:MAG: methyltransferase domain-containing protein [Nitrososphaerota archaeon]|nr:methyltransferase domain-containing protein [Nitrososphaerota archaeon]